MGAQLKGEVAMELSGSPAEIGLDVASKMLRAATVRLATAQDLGCVATGGQEGGAA